MNFLRSSFLSDATPTDAPTESGPEASTNPAPSSAWSLGSLVKSIGKVSGEVLESYKHDLNEFADGLKKESELLSEVTVHAVKDFPHSLEGSATVAHESLESVGQSLEEFGGSIWRGTSELFATVKDAVQKVDEETTANAKAKSSLTRELSATQVTSWKYSRYEAQVNAMQRDSSTYCDEPEDVEEYRGWRATFNLSEKKADIEALLRENTFMQELEARIVPLIVDYESFWTRYFYRLHKLQQVEDARADLVKRATSSTEEELSWDVEDETEEVRGDPEGSLDVRPWIVEDEVSDERKEQSVRFDEETSAASSPTGGRKFEHGDSHTDQQSGGSSGHDEEAISEGSTGSDWLVVPDDNQGVIDAPEKSASPQASAKVNSPAVLAKGENVDEKEHDLEGSGDSSASGPRKDKTESSKPQAGVDKKPAEEESEDWGDWE